jgi:hypothetical protein
MLYHSNFDCKRIIGSPWEGTTDAPRQSFLCFDKAQLSELLKGQSWQGVPLQHPGHRPWVQRPRSHPLHLPTLSLQKLGQLGFVKTQKTLSWSICCSFPRRAYDALAVKVWMIQHLRLERSFYLAPTGAQEMLICVRPSGPNLSRAVNLHHSGSNLQAISQE